MNWRIEASVPVTAPDLRGVLEAFRDEWIATTPQASDAGAAQAAELIAETHNAARAKAVESHARLVKEHAVKLDAVHSRIVAQMNAGIDAAMALADALPEGSYLRSTVSGHYEPGHASHLDERLSVCVDQARPPVK